jgi:PKD repeat protein
MAGTYTLVVTNTTDGCSTSISVDVDADQLAPVAQAIANDVITCTTTTVNVDGAGSSEGADFSYQWTTADGNIVSGGTELLAQVDAAGTYTLIVTNNTNGCAVETVVTVGDDLEAPAISVTDAELTCTATDVELCATVETGLTVIWQLASGDVEATCVTVSAAGTFSAKVIGTNGCEATAEAIVSVSADLPQVSAEPNESITCTVTEVVLTGTLDGDVADYTITWTNSAGDVIGSDLLDLTVMLAGTYTLSVVDINTGCETVLEYGVEESINTPVASYDITQTYGELSLSSTSAGQPSSYSWDFGNGVTSTDENPNVDLGETGIYNVCLTITNECGEDTNCTEVQYVAILEVSTEVQDIDCNSANNGTLDVNINGGLPDYTIAWTGPNGFTSTEANLTGLEPGDYELTLTDAMGNQIKETYTITQPDAIAMDNVVITNTIKDEATGSLSIDVRGGSGDLSYDWSNGMKGSTIEGLAEGDYTVDVTDENGCTMTFGPFSVVSVSSTGDLAGVNKFSVYPNPSIGDVIVDIELNKVINAKLNVTDIYGKTLQSVNVDAKTINTRLNLSEYASGLYLINLTSKEGTATKKVLLIK